MASEAPATTAAGGVAEFSDDSYVSGHDVRDLDPFIGAPAQLSFSGDLGPGDQPPYLAQAPDDSDDSWSPPRPTDAQIDLDSPEKPPATQIARMAFLEDGDTETAKQILDILHDPKNRSAYVSPYEHYTDDPDCEDIFNKVKNRDYKIAVAFDQSDRVVGTITLHYDPERSHVVTWYLGGVASDLQGQGLGPALYENVAALTFDTPRYDGAEPQLILGKVILKPENYHRQYSQATRKEFPHIYRMLMDLPFVDYIGTQKPSIAALDGEGHLPVALFQIGREDFAAYVESKEKPDTGQ